ncbi:MAG: hypothetical protein EWM50_06170 [Gottschalkiaceae bacterium]|nr:MAG: hypothetical protein EWM50_06170 [Gottschalkiaceae bacterium]
MIGRLPVIVFVMVLMAALTVSFIEYFIPLSLNFQFRTECRKTLLQMEEKNELTPAMISELEDVLISKGFNSISISPPHTKARGEKLNLKVVADYKYSKLTGIFKREDVIQRMEYNKYTVARRVLN